MICLLDLVAQRLPAFQVDLTSISGLLHASAKDIKCLNSYNK
jgi:hypothetical protein